MNSQISLKEACDFILDGTHGSPERVREGIPVLSAQNVTGGKLNFATNRFTTTAEYQAFSRRLAIRQGDVLLTIVGTIGRAAVIDELKPLIFQRSVAVLRPKGSLLDSHFLFHITQSVGFRDQIRKATNQSSQAGVYLGKLEQVKIPLPPIAQQNRIAAILDKAEELRSLRRQALRELDALTQSTFLEMFGDPVTNPKGLLTTTLLQVSRRITDGTHQPPKWSSHGIPFLFVSNIVDGQIDFETQKFISEETHASLMKRCPVEIGDVLYTTVGSYGNVALVTTNRKFSFQRHIAHIKPEISKIDPLFLASMLQSPGVRRQVDKAARGVAQKTVNLADLKDLIIFLPPLSLQQGFARRVEAIEQLKTTHRQSLAHLDALFASLQHRAFRGEL